MTSRTKFVPANAVNIVVEVNQTIVTNTRKQVPSRITLPGLYDRAFMMVTENGIMPVTDVLEDVEAIE
ncbi:MAG: hypothetical protein DRP01_02020 [Archaeoglobales archaeon]|nr:MAG: hypothetical protein DRP01_02020 [Archaeoglobales archaeon]